VRLFRITSAPARAKAKAIARPMPRPAPVTSATFPSSWKGVSDAGNRVSWLSAAQADIAAAKAFRPVDLADRAVSQPARCGKITPERRHPEYPPAIR